MKSRLALNGKMATGKSTLANELVKHLGFEIVSIGKTIKRTSSLLIDNTPFLFEYLRQMVDDSEKSDELFFTLIECYRKNYSNSEWERDTRGDLIKNQSYRDLLQLVATTGRDFVGDNIWCEFAKNESLLLLKKGIPVIIDDLRLPSEKRLFEEYNFSIIRLDIEKQEQMNRILNLYGKIDEKLLNHPTEVALDNAYFDLRIDTTTLSIVEVREKLIHFITRKENSLVI